MQRSKHTSEPIFENLPIASHVLDNKGFIVEVNAAECKMLDLNREQLIGAHVTEFVRNRESDLAKGDLKKKLKGKDLPNPFWRTYITGKDKLLPVEIHDTIVKTDDGEVSRIISTLEDVSSRMPIELACLEYDDLFLGMTNDRLPKYIHVLRKDLDGRFTFGNKNFLNFLKVKSSGFLGKTDFDFFDENLANHFRDDDYRVVSQRRTFETIEPNKKIGSKRPAYVHVVKSPIFDIKYNVVGVQGIFWPAHHRQQAIAAIDSLIMHLLLELKKDEEHYRSICNNLSIGIFRTSYDGAVLHYNPALEHMLGYAPQHGRGIGQIGDIAEIYHNNKKQEAPNFTRNDYLTEMDSMKHRSPKTFRYSVRKADGSVVRVKETSWPVRNRSKEDRIEFFEGLIEDISDQEDNQAKLDTLYHSMRLNEMLRSRVHNVKSKLTSLKGFSSLALKELREGGGAADKQYINSKLESCLRISDETLNLCTKMLETCSPESLIAQDGGEFVNLKHSLHQIVSDLLSIGSKVDIRKVSSSKDFRIRTNGKHVEECLSNVIQNAVQACGSGGAVETGFDYVTIAEKDLAEMEPGVVDYYDRVKAGEYCLFYCVNTESEFKRYRSAIERLKKRSNVKKTKVHGTGVGIGSACRFVCDELAGWVAVQWNQSKREVWFKAFIPVNRMVKRDADVVGNVVKADWKPGAQVLMVDDDRDLCSVVEEMLEAEGVCVVSAWSTSTALERFHDLVAGIRCVILDRNLGEETDSVDHLVSRVRGLRSDLPIVYFSGEPASGRDYGELVYYFEKSNVVEMIEFVLQQVSA